MQQPLEKLRNTVSPLVCQVFSMLSLENMPGKEVAAALGITTNAVYVYKDEAMKKLKELVTRAEK